MSRLFKVNEWESAGKWYSADTQDLKNGSSLWWIPARFLKITPEEYVTLLVEQFHAKVDFIPKTKRGNSLLFKYWDNYNDCHKYTLWINKQARNGNWTI